MDDHKTIWNLWQSLLKEFQPAFTYGGWARFAQWVTGTVLCPEEHTITQILTAMDLQFQWRNAERFAECGSWKLQEVEQTLMRLVQKELSPRWGKYRLMAVDDTKEHRASKNVWGTCTFHESTARSPNRATTVLAHNWVVMGELVAGRPWTYMPLASRLYFRKTQRPPGEPFRTKTALAVEMLREVESESETPILAAFDGAYAMQTVIEPCLKPKDDRRRIEFVTRLRKDARLYKPSPPPKKNSKKKNPRKWGDRLPSPQNHDQWQAEWQTGRAYVYGRTRSFRYKRLECCWSVSGPGQIVHVYIFEVEGYTKLWATVTSAVDLSPNQVLAANAGRFRQEDGFRDHKQRLGMEECRAWTKQPVLRTFQVQMVAQTLLRLLQFRLSAIYGDDWRPIPPWNPNKRSISILDTRRLFWRHSRRFLKVISSLGEMKKAPQSRFCLGRCTIRAA
jgi:hypothetical protein